MNKQKGRKGESIALNFLESQGLEFVEKNFCIWGGELDLIMRDKKNEIVFVEVKYRSSESVSAMEIISSSKIKSLIRSATFWISKEQLWNLNWRIDLVVVKEKLNKKYEIEWLKNAITDN